MRKLLHYDMGAFFVSFVFLIVISVLTYGNMEATNTTPNGTNATASTAFDQHVIMNVLRSEQFNANVFWSKALYALLSFPFVIFVIPVVATVLTHSYPTGYNEHGACVYFALKPMPDDNDHDDRFSGSSGESE